MMPAQLYTYRGKQYTAVELARATGMSEKLLYCRIKSGKTAEEAVAMGQSMHGGKKYLFRGREMMLTQIAAETGINIKMLRERMHKGWSLDEAIETPKGGTRQSVTLHRDCEADPTDGMSLPEIERWNAAKAVCREIIFGNAADANFRCVTPMIEYAFEGDVLGWRIHFAPEGCRAHLTARYLEHGFDSDFHREYLVDGEKVKEVRQE